MTEPAARSAAAQRGSTGPEQASDKHRILALTRVRSALGPSLAPERQVGVLEHVALRHLLVAQVVRRQQELAVLGGQVAHLAAAERGLGAQVTGTDAAAGGSGVQLLEDRSRQETTADMSRGPAPDVARVPVPTHGRRTAQRDRGRSAVDGALVHDLRQDEQRGWHQEVTAAGGLIMYLVHVVLELELALPRHLAAARRAFRQPRHP